MKKRERERTDTRNMYAIDEIYDYAVLGFFPRCLWGFGMWIGWAGIIATLRLCCTEYMDDSFKGLSLKRAWELWEHTFWRPFFCERISGGK